MVTVYLKTTEVQPMSSKVQVQKHEELIKARLFISEIAKSHDGSSDVRIFEARSPLYTEDEIMQKLGTWSEKINKIQAYLEGKTLQPDRIVPDFDMITGEETTRNYSFDDVFPLTLEEAQQIKCYEIDYTTVILTDASEIDFNGNIYSNSYNAQAKWNGISTKKNDGKIKDTDTFKVSLKNNKAVDFSAGDIQTVTDMMFEAAITINQAGTILKDQVMNCTEIQQVFDIIDNR